MATAHGHRLVAWMRRIRARAMCDRRVHRRLPSADEGRACARDTIDKEALATNIAKLETQLTQANNRLIESNAAHAKLRARIRKKLDAASARGVSVDSVTRKNYIFLLKRSKNVVRAKEAQVSSLQNGVLKMQSIQTHLETSTTNKMLLDTMETFTKALAASNTCIEKMDVEAIIDQTAEAMETSEDIQGAMGDAMGACGVDMTLGDDDDELQRMLMDLDGDADTDAGFTEEHKGHEGGTAHDDVVVDLLPHTGSANPVPPPPTALRVRRPRARPSQPAQRTAVALN